jgi:NitT/TauT family transport system substrate-binding protein
VPLHIALDQGYFAKEGLDVQANIDLGAGSTVEAVIGNQVDMAWVNLGGALQPYAEGIDLRLVQISDHGKPGGMQVLVKSDSPAQELSDLVGNTLAVLSPSTTCAWLVKKALIDAGQPVDAITMTEVSPPDHPVVLESGNVEATCTTDPTRTVMTSEFGARPIFDAATDGAPELQSYPVGGYVVSGEFAEQNPLALAAFKRALTKAAAYANANPEEVRAKLSTFTTADPEIADKVVINEYVETGDMGTLSQEVQQVAEVMVETGILSEVPDIDGFVLRGEQSGA